MRNAIAVLLTFLVSACTIAIPESVKDQVNLRGAHAIRAIKSPFGTYFTSTSFVPGATASHPHVTWQRIACQKGALRGTTSFTSTTERKVAIDACNSMLDAVDYMTLAGRPKADIEYQAVIVPNGEGTKISTRSMSPYTKLKVRFAFSDSMNLLHSVVAIFAHEYLHVVRELEKPGHVVTGKEEELGYMAEICAQLEVLGSVSRQDLPGTPITSAPSAVSRSSEEGFRVRRYALEHFTGDVLAATSPSGRSVLADCKIRLGNGEVNDPSPLDRGSLSR